MIRLFLQKIDDMIEPLKFNKYFKVIFAISLALGIALVFCAIWDVIFYVPDDYLQGYYVKIMYVHVPSAWISVMIYTAMTLFSCAFLISRKSFLFVCSMCCAGSGATFAFLTLVTGAIWGKPTWGTYWVWDARLTSVLILFFVYLCHIILYSSVDTRQEKNSKVCAIFTVVCSINIPIIKFSVDIWSTLHQGSSIMRLDGPSIHPSMLYPLITMFCGILCIAIFVICVRIKSHLLYIKKERMESKLIMKQTMPI